MSKLREEYEPLELPIQDPSLRSRLSDAGILQTFFKIWDGVLNAKYGIANEQGKIWITFFQVKNACVLKSDEMDSEVSSSF